MYGYDMFNGYVTQARDGWELALNKNTVIGGFLTRSIMAYHTFACLVEAH